MFGQFAGDARLRPAGRRTFSELSHSHLGFFKQNSRPTKLQLMDKNPAPPVDMENLPLF